MDLCQQSTLFFNTLSRFAIAFLPRSKRLLISWVQSTSAVILEPKKIKSVTLSIRWPKYRSFSFSIRPSSEYSGLTSFRIGWFDLLAVQGTLKSHLQHHSSKATILQHSVFFMIQFSHPYMTTGKTIALTGRTFAGKVMSLLFNMLSRLVIAFLPRSKHLLISWLQSPSAVILEPKKIVCHCFPIYLP